MAQAVSFSDIKSGAVSELPSLRFEIERGQVARFTRAIGDDNPRWRTEAPPTLALTLGFDRMLDILNTGEPVTILHGSSELESYQPIKIGDTLSLATRVASVRQRPGKMGNMAFISFEMSLSNQGGEPVATCRQLAIVY